MLDPAIVPRDYCLLPQWLGVSRAPCPILFLSTVSFYFLLVIVIVVVISFSCSSSVLLSSCFFLVFLLYSPLLLSVV